MTHDLVTGEFGLRFYAGIPVRSTRGSVIGTLCVVDSRPRSVAAGELATLHDLLGSKRTIEKWVAIEALAAMKIPEENARIAKVSGNQKLTGYWGNQTDKPEPTLGQHAKELASGSAK